MQPSGSLKVVQERLSLRERTTAVLRNAILTMRFKPGERLVERQLCVETGVSRTCVRESMRHLEAEGLVRREHNKGIFVASITTAEAAEIYEVRRILETKMLEKMIVGVDLKVVADIAAALRKAEAVMDQPTNYVSAIGELIASLWSGYGNGVAQQLLRSMFDRISYIRVVLGFSTTPEQKSETIRILTGVLEAIERRDVAAAQERYAHYLSRAEATAVGIIEAAKASQIADSSLATSLTPKLRPGRRRPPLADGVGP